MAEEMGVVLGDPMKGVDAPVGDGSPKGENNADETD